MYSLNILEIKKIEMLVGLFLLEALGDMVPLTSPVSVGRLHSLALGSSPTPLQPLGFLHSYYD